MEIVLVIAAASGLLGCFGAVARLDVAKKRERMYRPLVRAAIRSEAV